MRSDLVFAPEILSDLALAGVIERDSAETYFGRWLGAGELGKAFAGLPWWAASGDTLRLRQFHRRPELKPFVTEAREALRRLSSETGS